MNLKLKPRHLLLASVVTVGIGAVGLLGHLLLGNAAIPILIAFCSGLGLFAYVQASQSLRECKITVRRHYQQVEALLGLLATLDIKLPLPSMRGWAISPDVARILASTILVEKPTVIVECGSGVSTLVMAYCVKKNGHGCIISLEDEEQFAKTTRANLESHGLMTWAQVITAPLKKVDLHGESYLWYDRSNLKNLQGIELLYVDGPHAKWRYPSLPLLANALSSHATVIIDDADSDAMKGFVSAWMQQFPNFDRKHIDTEKGTIILTRQGNNRGGLRE